VLEAFLFMPEIPLPLQQAKGEICGRMNEKELTNGIR
jgi:hypothetical protein